MPVASMMLASGLAFAVAWQGVNLWRQPHSIPMPVSIGSPVAKDPAVQFGVKSGGVDLASRAPPDAESSRVAADEASPVGVVVKVPRDEAPESNAQNAPAAPLVDETALRYFAQQGDTRRLNAEIARLRSLYPDWTPPLDPLKAPPVVDSQLDHLWQLFAKGQFAAVREAIAARQSAEPNWIVPQNLVDRLALADLRERLVNAFDAKQYAMVIQIAAANPSLRTCGDVDTLWRIAEAFVRTDSQSRALDAYRYILTNCPNGPERVATMQKAAGLLPPGVLDPLFKLGRAGPEADEFRSLREDLARRAVSARSSDPKAEAGEQDIATLEQLTKSNQSPADPMLLGWYFLRRADATAAEHWFQVSYDRQHAAESAQGLSLALVLLKKPAEAEATLARWRDASEDAGKAYIAAATSLLAQQPAPVIAPDVLARIVEMVAKRRDAAAAQQLGWFARSYGQEETAAQWFASALSWKPDDEPSAYGLAVANSALKRSNSLRALARAWGSRSRRVLAVVSPGKASRVQTAGLSKVTPRAAGQAGAVNPPQMALLAPENGSSPSTELDPTAGQNDGSLIAKRRASIPGGQCRATGVGSLPMAWCLMQLNRPGEAVPAFRAVLSAGTAKERQDAAYGLSLAELNLGLTAEAEVAATAAPQSNARVGDLRLAIVTQRIFNENRIGDYAGALNDLDTRARMAPESMDLMMVRGWCYFHLQRYEEAARIFDVAVASGHDEALSALNTVKSLIEPNPHSHNGF